VERSLTTDTAAVECAPWLQVLQSIEFRSPEVRIVVSLPFNGTATSPDGAFLGAASVLVGCSSCCSGRNWEMIERAAAK
jgi:hypothetical protein